MKKLIQTRMSTKEQKGNCFPTVISCFMGLESPEDCIQIQEHYDNDEWWCILESWLHDRGWKITGIKGHLYNDIFYTVSGKTIRGTNHICIYQNGELYHDPHPSGVGLITEDVFERIIKLDQ